MHKLRTKKVKNCTQKYLPNVFNDNIVQLLLDKNEKAIQQISKNHIDKAQDIINKIKHEIQMLSDGSTQKYVVRAVSLNTEAYFWQKQNDHEHALERLTSAEQLEKQHKLGTILMARTKLNKSVILSYLERHEQSIKLGREALDLLKNNKDSKQLQLGKNRYKLYQIMIISFYNIATELSHLKDLEQAAKVFKEGFHLSLRTLGSNHKLTILLRSMVKNSKQRSISKQNIQLSHSIQKPSSKFKSVLLVPIDEREKQLRRIYASKRKPHSVAKEKKKGEVDYYARSLEKIKLLYSRKSSESYKPRLQTAVEISKGSKRSLRYAGIMTESGQRTMRSSQPSRAQQIFNNSIDRKRVCSSQVHEQRGASNNMKGSMVALDPIVETKPLQQDHLMTSIAHKFQEKSKHNQSQCQLI